MLTLWLAFVGGLVATREGKHLTLSTAELFGGRPGRQDRASLRVLGGRRRRSASWPTRAPQVVLADRDGGKMLPIGVPEWVSETIMPIALGPDGGALRLARRPTGWRGRAVALRGHRGGVRALACCRRRPLAHVWPLRLVILAAALLGAPVFVAMGGIALVLFFRDGHAGRGRVGRGLPARRLADAARRSRC